MIGPIPPTRFKVDQFSDPGLVGRPTDAVLSRTRKAKCLRQVHKSWEASTKNCDNRCGDVVFGRDQLNIVTNRKIGVQLFFGTPIAVLLAHRFGAATGGTPSVV